MQPEATIDIACTPEKIFPYLIDPALLVQWQQLLTDARQMTEGDVRVGSRFRNTLDFSATFPQARLVLGTSKIVLEGRVVDYEPNRLIKLRGESEFNTFVIAYICTPVTETTTRLTQKSEFNFNLLFLKPFAPTITTFLAQQGRSDLRRLKALVEAECKQTEEP